MSKVTLVKSVVNDSLYGILVSNGDSVSAVAVDPSADQWTQWVNESVKSLEQISSSLGSTVYCEASKPATDNHLSSLEKNVDRSTFLAVKSLISEESLEYSGSHDGTSRRYVSMQFKSTDFPVSPSSLPINHFSPEARRAVLRYKVATKVSDNTKARLEYEVKKVRALWDPKLGPSGGYRCPPGTEFGGYITDRFGRGCTTGALRRVGAALGRAGRGIERIGEDRQLRRLARVERRTLRKKPGPSRAQRASMALERGARRLVGDWQPGDGGRTSRRNIPGRAPTSRTTVVRPAPRPKRVIVPQAGRPSRTQGARPRPKPIVQRASQARTRRERFALALERWADRILRGPNRQGTSTVPPRRPPAGGAAPSPRAKKRNVSQARRPAPNLRRPQPKRQNGVSIDSTKLTPSQKTKLRSRAVLEFQDVDSRWRRRLQLGPNDRVDPRDIADYIKKRQDAKRSEGYLGMLRADANDWDVLREFRKTGDVDLLNRVGPTRRKKMVDESGISGTGTKRPAPKPAVKKPAAKKPATKKPAPKKKPAAKKAPSKRTPAKKAPAKKPAAKKAPAKKTAPKKATPAKKAPAKKPVAKKAPAKKAPAKATPAKKAPAKKPAVKPTPAKKAPSQVTPKAKPGKKKTTTVAKAQPKKPTVKPKANMRSLRTTDDYAKAKKDQDTINRIQSDLVDKIVKQRNVDALRRQQEIIDQEVQRLNTVFRGDKTSDKNRAVALAGLDALKKRKQKVTQGLDMIAKADKERG